MSDEILRKIDALRRSNLSRRSFLRGGVAAAAVIGASAALPAVLHGQSQAQNPPEKQGDKDEKKPDPDRADDNGNSDTKTDAQGREYRECPQCGGNMYRQGRTWTCENCGYSYVE